MTNKVTIGKKVSIGNNVVVGSRRLKAGDRVAQSRSLQCFIPSGEGFPWQVVRVWDGGQMAKLEWVGQYGQESGGYANAVLTSYLVKQF